MFEKFLSNNVDNFRQRYEGTYGFYRTNDGRRILTMIRSVGQVCEFVDANNINYTLNADSPNNIGFEFLPPRSQWYNTATGPMFVKRGARRQWQRGISAANTLIYYPLMNRVNLAATAVNFVNLEKIYNDVNTPSFLQAWNLFKQHKAPCAISRAFAFAFGNVWLYDTPIGTYTYAEGKLFLSLGQPDLWGNEIKDALKPFNTPMEIL